MKSDALNNQILLIFGMPRSGTTWLGKIIDSHPDIIYLHEPDSEFRLKEVPLLVTPESYPQYKELIRIYCSELLNKCTTRVCGKTPFFKKSYLSGIKYLVFKLNLLLAKIVERTGLTIPVWNPFKTDAINTSIVAWKSIESCGRLGLILDAVPENKAIYIIRHPCGQIASVLNGEKSGNFSSKAASSEDFKLFEDLLHSKYAVQHNLTIKEIKAMKPIERSAIRWVLYNEQAIEDIEVNNNRAMIIRYEDICSNPELETKRMYNFFNLNWNEQTEQFIKQSTSENKGTYYSVFKNPSEAMNKWRQVFTAEEIDLIKNTIGKSRAGKLFVDYF